MRGGASPLVSTQRTLIGGQSASPGYGGGQQPGYGGQQPGSPGYGGSPGSHDRNGRSPDSPPYTRQYSYEELDQEPRRAYSPTSHGFRYEGDRQGGGNSDLGAEDGGQEVRRSKAQAFNYAPGGLGKAGETSPALHSSSAPEGAGGDGGGVMPESLVDDGTTTSGMDTSTEVAGVAGLTKKTKKNKKDKDKKKKKATDDKLQKELKDGGKMTKDEKAMLKAQKKHAKKPTKDDKKKKKSKFGIFGGRRKKEVSSSSSSDSSDSSSSSDDSESDDSVIQETRVAAQPGDLDASLAASERLMHESGVMSQADVSNRSYSVGDQTLTAQDTNSAVVGGGGPKVVRTTTKKTTLLAQGGELSESTIERTEDGTTGEVEISTHHQTKVSCTKPM